MHGVFGAPAGVQNPNEHRQTPSAEVLDARRTLLSGQYEQLPLMTTPVTSHTGFGEHGLVSAARENVPSGHAVHTSGAASGLDRPNPARHSVTAVVNEADGTGFTGVYEP